jgi:excisionase family DNA binding protein
MRQSLTVREAAFLLQVPEMVIRRMIERGTLDLLGDRRTADGRRHCRICPSSVRAALPAGSCRQQRVLIALILAGRFVVPAPATRWGAPFPLERALEAIRA